MEIIDRHGPGNCVTCPTRASCTVLCSEAEAHVDAGGNIPIDALPWYGGQHVDGRRYRMAEDHVDAGSPQWHRYRPEMAERIARRLTTRQRVVTLLVLQGLEFDAIAARMGIDSQAVQKIYRRAIDRLRR